MHSINDAWPVSESESSLLHQLHKSTTLHQALVDQRRRKLLLDFGCAVPFTIIPPFIQTGFNELADHARQQSRDEKVTNHFKHAQHLLKASLGRPEVDLMLMLAITITSSTETVVFDKDERKLVINTIWKKSQAARAAVLVTRMLWYYLPKDWNIDGNSCPSTAPTDMLTLKEMTLKIEQWKVSTGMLLFIGWVKSQSRRVNPRLKELELAPLAELQARGKEFIKNINNTEAFIRCVFNDRENTHLWINRCRSIIREEEA
ncbi:hypothetical protein V8C42DRAFT_244061 [Trichoderma barbatum]